MMMTPLLLVVSEYDRPLNEQIMMLIMMMALVPLVVSDYDRPNKRTKRGGELEGGRKRAGINDHSAATEKI